MNPNGITSGELDRLDPECSGCGRTPGWNFHPSGGYGTFCYPWVRDGVKWLCTRCYCDKRRRLLDGMVVEVDKADNITLARLIALENV